MYARGSFSCLGADTLSIENSIWTNSDDIVCSGWGGCRVDSQLTTLDSQCSNIYCCQFMW